MEGEMVSHDTHICECTHTLLSPCPQRVLSEPEWTSSSKEAGFQPLAPCGTSCGLIQA